MFPNGSETLSSKDSAARAILTIKVLYLYGTDILAHWSRNIMIGILQTLWNSFPLLQSVSLWIKVHENVPKGPINIKPVMIQIMAWWSCLLTYIRVSRPGGVNSSRPSHYINLCWDIINWTLWNKIQWILKRNETIALMKRSLQMSSVNWQPI